MSEFLEASGKKPDELGFFEKAKACEELKPPDDLDGGLQGE